MSLMLITTETITQKTTIPHSQPTTMWSTQVYWHSCFTYIGLSHVILLSATKLWKAGRKIPNVIVKRFSVSIYVLRIQKLKLTWSLDFEVISFCSISFLFPRPLPALLTYNGSMYMDNLAATIWAWTDALWPHSVNARWERPAKYLILDWQDSLHEAQSKQTVEIHNNKSNCLWTVDVTVKQIKLLELELTNWEQ